MQRGIIVLLIFLMIYKIIHIGKLHDLKFYDSDQLSYQQITVMVI